MHIAGSYHTVPESSGFAKFTHKLMSLKARSFVAARCVC